MTASDVVERTANWPAWKLALAHRWPTLLALVMAGLTWGPSSAQAFSMGLVLSVSATLSQPS